MNVTDTILSQFLSRSPWSRLNGLHPFPPTRRNFFVWNVFRLFKGLIPYYLKSRLKFLSRFTSRQFISFWAFNTIWKPCICLFLCFLPLFPYTQNFTRSRATFSATSNQLPQCSGNLAFPLPDPYPDPDPDLDPEEGGRRGATWES